MEIVKTFLASFRKFKMKRTIELMFLKLAMRNRQDSGGTIENSCKAFTSLVVPVVAQWFQN